MPGGQISEQTFHRWKREMGMLEVDQAKQLKELQRENARSSVCWPMRCSAKSC
jgi:hypothetical protein